jgi:uncharacterized repeat protein (TIGR03803 family)
VVLDQLESRVMLSVSNNGYALSQVASFGDSLNAEIPSGTLVMDSNGDLFGTSEDGGAHGDGAVFEIPAGSDTVQTLDSFNGANGIDPTDSGLAIDSAGNLYGTTQSGGAEGNGTVFEIPESNPNTIAVLGSFAGGQNPGNTVAVDSSGNVFGIIEDGGENDTGSIWEIPAGSSELANVGGANSTTIASFDALVSGRNSTGAFPDPDSTLLIHDGSIYGTTASGGTDEDGTVFSESGGDISPMGIFTAVSNCESNLVMDGNGNIFGTSAFGGGVEDGYVFELPSGQTRVSVIGEFNGTDGEFPFGSIYEDGNGNIFGTTSSGGSDNAGVAFELPTTGENAGTLLVLANSTGTPESGIIADSNGDLFGSESSGGGDGTGDVFELTPVHLVVSDVPTLFNVNTDTVQDIEPVVTLEGPTGQRISNDDSSVTLTISDGGAVVNNTATSSNGVADFPEFGVTTSGDYFLTATDTNDDVPGASEDFTVAPQPQDQSTHLVFLTQPVYNHGEVPTVTVALENVHDQIVTSDNSVVTLEIASGPGDLGGTLSVQAQNGEATFTDLTVSEAGFYTLAAFDDFFLTEGISAGFNAVAVPTGVVIVQGPTQPLIAGTASAQSVEVLLVDQFDDPINQGSAPVQLTAVDGVGKTVHLGTVNMVHGLATFKHIKIDEASEFELVASSKGLDPDSRGIGVEPAAGASLAFVLGPPQTTAGAAFSVSVEVLDKFGNVDYLDDSDITLSLASGSAGTLSGTKTVAASDGVAVFGGLSVSKAGKYQIVATDATLHKTIRTKVFVVA